MKKLFLLLTWLIACPIGMLAQGTTWQSATTLSSGTSGSGTLDEKTTDLWYKIEVTGDGTAELTVTPSGTLNIRILELWWVDADGNIHSRNTSGVGTETATLTVTDLGKGTFYVLVSRWSGGGSFTLNYNFTPSTYANDAEPNDTFDKGALIKSGETVQGHLGYVDGTSYRDPDDYYKIEVPRDGTVSLTVTPEKAYGLNIRILELWWCDENGNIHSRNTTGVGLEPATLTVTDVGKGTFYVLVSRWSGHGGYSLKYDFTPSGYENDPEPNDTFEKGSLLENGQTVQGHLGYVDGTSYRDPDDYYKIEVPSDGTVSLTVNPEKAYGLNIRILEIWWRDADGNIRSRNTSGVGTEPATLTVTDVGKGTYYVLVSRWSGHGGYSLKYEFTPSGYENDPEPNDTFEKGSLLENGQTVQGHLGYVDGTSYRDPDDYYKIEVPRDGTVNLTVTPEKAYGLNIRILEIWWLDENGGIHSRNTSGVGTEPATLTVTDVGKGTYYVLVSRWSGHGGYSLKYEFVPNPFAGDVERNDSFDQAKETLYNGQTMKGHIGYCDGDNVRDNDDWFKLDVPEAGTVTLSVTPEQTYDLNLRILELWKLGEDGQVHSLKTSGVGTKPASLSYTLSEGTFYVLVSRWSGHDGYTLHYDFEEISYKDVEPNDDYTSAITVHDGESKVGNLGFERSGTGIDEDDWYKTTVDDGGQLIISYVPDSSESLDVTLVLYYLDNNELKEIRSEWTHLQSKIIETDENLKGGTYYLKVHRNGGAGTYSLTFGTATRADGSMIRVSFSGHDQVRLGIPSEYTVTVENLDSKPSGNFFLVIPVTEDIKLLGATLPGRSGYIEDLPLEEVTYEGDPGNEGMWFVVPSMDPYERYSFTIRAEGLVIGKDRANVKPIVFTSTSLLVIGGLIVLNSAIDYAGDQVIGFCTDVINETVDIQGGKEVDYYREKINKNVDQDLATYKKDTGVSVVAGKRVVKTIVTQALDVIPGGKIVNFAGELIETAAALGGSLYRRFWYFIRKDLDPNYKEWEKNWESKHLDTKVGCNQVVRSFDPNEMVGPVGVGEGNYIADTRTIDYRILFENKAEATAPAYRIRISDELDPNVFDVSSVRFGGTSHDNAGFGWKMTREGNKLFWDIEGIELPPNVNAPEGEGYVTFSVDLKPGLENKSEIKNKATIIFDYNEAIETNEYLNTLDLKEPVATMVSATAKGGVITIKCKGSDGESGVSHYQYFASYQGGEYLFLGEAIQPQFEYTLPSGTKAEDYKFFALAVDNVGNTQQTPPAAIDVNSSGAAGSGDANGDGTVNAADIVEVVNYIMGSPSGKFDIGNADVNGDGTVNAADIVGIVNIIMGN